MVRRLPILMLFVLAACSREVPVPVHKQAPRRVAATQTTPAPAQPKAQPQPQPPAKPNIILITLDTFRFDSTSLDPRHTHDDTPFLGELAESGVNFTRFYSTQDSTPLSHFSLFTGFITGYQTPIDQPNASVAFQLRKRGYHTFAVVANGTLSPHLFRSITGFRDIVNLNDLWDAMPADRKAKELVGIDARIHEYDSEPNPWSQLVVFSSAAEVFRHLEGRLDGAQHPFFAFINFLDAHDPYMPDRRYYSKKWEPKKRSELRSRTLPDWVLNPNLLNDPKRKEEIEKKIAQAAGRPWSTSFDLDETDLRIFRRRYEAEVRETDAAVRKLFDMLRQRHLLESTIVIITADHGEAFGEDKLLTHTFYNRGDLEVTNHIPMLIVFPPSYGIRGEVKSIATNADITPTIYDLLGIDPYPIWKTTEPANFGHSLLPLLRAYQVNESKTAAVVDPSTNVKTPEQKRQDEEALKRFKSLGYMN